MALIQCPNCQKDISDSCKKCIHCGFELKSKPTVMCPECGHENQITSKFCIKCGYKLELKSKIAASDFTKKIINLLKNILNYIKKHKIPVILSTIGVISVIIAVSVITLLTQDPFSKLKHDLSKSEIISIYGQPDSESKTVLRYHNVKILGKNGTLDVYYYGHDDNTAMYYYYPTSKNDAQIFMNNIKSIYTLKYGLPHVDDEMYFWGDLPSNPDNKGNGVDCHYTESLIRIRWWNYGEKTDDYNYAPIAPDETIDDPTYNNKSPTETND